MPQGLRACGDPPPPAPAEFLIPPAAAQALLILGSLHPGSAGGTLLCGAPTALFWKSGHWIHSGRPSVLQTGEGTKCIFVSSAPSTGPAWPPGDSQET